MLDHLDQLEAATAVMTVVERVLRDNLVKTPDMGGTATTQDLGGDIEAVLG